MIKKKMPQRKCAGCGTVKDKKELLRIVRSPENEVFVDVTGKKSGRGIYICSTPECLKKTRKIKKIERTLEADVSDEVFQTLEKLVEEAQHNNPDTN